MRISAVLHPAVLFALPDGAGTEIAHPRIVRIAGRRSLVISIKISPAGRSLAPPFVPGCYPGEGVPAGAISSVDAPITNERGKLFAAATAMSLRKSRLSMFEPLLRGSLAIFIGSGRCRFVPEHDQRETIGLKIDLLAHRWGLTTALNVNPVFR